MHSFLAASIGGALAACASSINLLLNGEITGMSGILNGVVSLRSDRHYRLALLGGLIAAGSILRRVTPSQFGLDTYPPLSAAALCVSGLLVGFGSVVGSGCTSGHGICGLPRLSKRSIAAVGTFMATAAVTTNTILAVPALKSLVYLSDSEKDASVMYAVIPRATEVSHVVAALIILYCFFATPTKVTSTKGSSGVSASQIATGAATGLVFGCAMVASGMVSQTKVLSFLSPLYDATNGWDPSLMFVMGAGVGINLVTFNSLILSRNTPILKSNFNIPTATAITPRLVVGSALFGIGWGLGGICPAPGMVNLVTGRVAFYAWFASVVVGMIAANAVGGAGGVVPHKARAQ